MTESPLGTPLRPDFTRTQGSRSKLSQYLSTEDLLHARHARGTIQETCKDAAAVPVLRRARWTDPCLIQRDGAQRHRAEGLSSTCLLSSPTQALITSDSLNSL